MLAISQENLTSLEMSTNAQSILQVSATSMEMGLQPTSKVVF